MHSEITQQIAEAQNHAERNEALNLLPCPFCGSKAGVEESTYNLAATIYYVTCTNYDKCRTTVGWYMELEDVVKVWNSRKEQ